MANVGQIVYNLQDYQQSGGYISTSNANVNATVVSSSADYESTKINIFTNVVTRYASNRFTKLGIQAAPGTQFILNENKSMIVGRSGIYELDEDIVITSLKFIKPKRYIKNEGATQTALAEGTQLLAAAEANRQSALDTLNALYPDDTPKDEAYWRRYTEIQEDYEEEYDVAYNRFNEGVNGIYKLDTENPEQDLKNVIIDFLY